MDGIKPYGPQMYNVLTQTNTASMRTNRHAKFLRHQQYTQYLSNTRKPAGIDLANIDSSRLKKLFECYSVVCVLACGNSNAVRREGLAYGGVSKNVIRGGGLLDEPKHDGFNLHV